MNHKERMFAAFRHQPVDRIPFATYNLHPFSAPHRHDPSYTGLLDLVWNEAGMLCKTGITRQETPATQAEAARLEVVRQTLPVLFYTGGPEICTPPMMAPAMFAKLVTPYQKKLIRMIHDAGFLASIHCHGRVRDVIGEVLATGADVFEPIEPPDQGDISLPELFTAAGNRLCLMGHIQDQEFHYVEPGTMTRHVEEIARVAAGRTGYVMMPTCTPFQHPATDTFRRNYAEWIEAAARMPA